MSGRPSRVRYHNSTIRGNVISSGDAIHIGSSVSVRRCKSQRIRNSAAYSYLQRLYSIPLFTSLNQTEYISEKQIKIINHLRSLQYKNRIETYNYNKNTPYVIVDLYQSDFERGTVRITKPGIYVLQSDIEFIPNFENDYQPNRDDISSGRYPVPGPYQLGFFAAITIESDDVILDLNGYTIRQSKEHFIQQRFYANIELGSSPFVMDQGPSSGITGTYKAPTKVSIINGTLGLSSHHGIHGNLMNECVLYNLHITDFQVAGIALNGGSNNILCDIHVESTTGVKDDSFGVPINFQYSQGRFIRPFLQSLKKSIPDATLTIENNEVTINTIIEELNDALDDSFYHALNGENYNITDVFKNNTRVSDGNVYGIIFNVKGVAVHGFLNERDTNDPTIGNEDNYIKNINIHDIHSNPVETRVIIKYENVNDHELGYNNNGVIKGPVGDVFDINYVTNKDNGLYIPNVLANAQLILGKYKVLDVDDELRLGTTTFRQEIIDWVEQNITHIDSIIQDCPEDSHDMDVEELANKLVYKDGLDAMSHVMKGNFGLFLSGTKNIVTEHVILNNHNNFINSQQRPPHAQANVDLCIVASDNIDAIRQSCVFSSIFVQE